MLFHNMANNNDNNKQKVQNIDNTVVVIARVEQKAQQAVVNLIDLVYGAMIKKSDPLEKKGKHYTLTQTAEDTCATYAVTQTLHLMLESALKANGINDEILELSREIGKQYFELTKRFQKKV